MIVTNSTYLLALALLCLSIHSDAFQALTKRNIVVSRGNTLAPISRWTATTRRTETKLHNLFGNLFGQQEEPSSKPPEGGNSAAGNPVVDVIDVPAKVIKIKPLKFFLQLFLVSYQNTPVKGAWLLNANDEVEDYLEVYYADGTGMISMQFDPAYGLRIQRKGQRPSLQYMLQESVLLHAVLDELEAVAFGEGDGDVKDDERLLQFSEENQDVLSRARAKLPARAAPAE